MTPELILSLAALLTVTLNVYVAWANRRKENAEVRKLEQETDVNPLAHTLEASNDLMDMLRKDNEEQRMLNTSLRKEKVGLEERITAVERDCADSKELLTRQITGLQKQNEELTRENAGLRAELILVRRDLVRMDGEIRDLSQKLARQGEG